MAFVKKPGTWLRDNLPTNEPFWLEKQLDDLEDRLEAGFNTVIAGGGGATQADLDALEARVDTLEAGGGAPTILGNDFVGASSGALTINHSIVIPVAIPGSGSVKIEVWVAGDGGSVGAVSLRGDLYEGVDAGSALIGTGTPTAVSNGATGAWVTVADGIHSTIGTKYAGVHVGGTNGVATARFNTGASGSSYFNNDTYSDGTAAVFGTATAETKQWSIRVTFTLDDLPTKVAILETDLDSAEADILALDLRVDTTEGDISALESQVTALEAIDPAGSGTLFGTDLNNELILANEVYASEPLDLSSGDVGQVAYGYETSTAGSASLQVGAEGVSFAARATAASALFGDARVLTKQPQARLIYTQGAADATVSIFSAVTR